MEDLKNNFKFLFPELALQWHPTLNGEKKPENFTRGSGEKVWWECDKRDDHEWPATINDRTRKDKPTNCPECSRLNRFKR